MRPAARRFAWMAAALALGGLGWVYTDFRRDLERAKGRIASGSTVAQTACGPIEYASTGEGPPLLLVHGSGGGFDQGLLFGRDLAARGARVIAMSRFGYLRTPRPADDSPEAQADAHACLLDALGLERAAILGASAGALSALQFAIRHPERCLALVLVVPLAWRPDAPPADEISAPMRIALRALESDLGMWLLLRAAPTLATRTILATPDEVMAEASPADRLRARSMFETILPVSARIEGLALEQRNAAALRRYALETIRAPTLMIGVKDDLYGTWASARYTASQIRGARFLDFETGGHVWIGHHEEVLAAIAGFLNTNSGREPEA